MRRSLRPQPKSHVVARSPHRATLANHDSLPSESGPVGRPAHNGSGDQPTTGRETSPQRVLWVEDARPVGPAVKRGQDSLTMFPLRGKDVAEPRKATSRWRITIHFPPSVGRSGDRPTTYRETGSQRVGRPAHNVSGDEPTTYRETSPQRVGRRAHYVSGDRPTTCTRRWRP